MQRPYQCWILGTRIQVPQEAVELYGKSSQDTDQNVNLAKITAARKASKVTTWNTCGACCSLNRFWQVCFFARMNVRRSTGKQTKRQRREHQVYISLSRVAEQVSSRPTHAWEMWFCKTWQIPQHRTKIIKMCKTNILSPRRQAPHPSSQITNIASYCNNGKPKQHIYHSTFTEPEMCRRYIWALTRPPSPPFDVAHVESDSGCLWCHKPMCDVFMITAMCHHSSHGTSTSHLYVYLQCFGDTHEQKEGLLQRRNNTTKKRPNMEALCLTPHHLAILRRQRTSSRRTEFARTFARC